MCPQRNYLLNAALGVSPQIRAQIKRTTDTCSKEKFSLIVFYIGVFASV